MAVRKALRLSDRINDLQNNIVMIRSSQLFIAFLFLSLLCQGQVPHAFKYQAVIRDTSGVLISDHLVSLKISVIKSDINGETVYSEIHDVFTNQFGIINLEIGRGLNIEGDFDQVHWGEDTFFIRLEIDMDGAMNYVLLGTTQLLSVPYALYAQSSGSDTLKPLWEESARGIYYDDGNIGIGTSDPDSSALVDLTSDSKGFLPPRLTRQQILEISNPANGLLVYCSNDDKYYVFTTSTRVWKEILFGPGIIAPPFPCGDSVITVHHIAGAVAPVSKTVTYGTVSDIAGEPLKCWITQNLGADHKAFSVNDDTEASAGWYWQFNRKQGFKHDGTTRTPNTDWISDISENSDWMNHNDPCFLEIGNNWRLPTFTELYNVDNAGGWEDWNGPWNSPLKIHMAGYLFEDSGVLMQRGETGSVTCSTQDSEQYHWYLYIQNDVSQMKSYYKGYAQTIRCITE